MAKVAIVCASSWCLSTLHRPRLLDCQPLVALGPETHRLPKFTKVSYSHSVNWKVTLIGLLKSPKLDSNESLRLWRDIHKSEFRKWTLIMKYLKTLSYSLRFADSVINTDSLEHFTLRHVKYRSAINLSRKIRDVWRSSKIHCTWSLCVEWVQDDLSTLSVLDISNDDPLLRVVIGRREILVVVKNDSCW